MVKCVDRKQNNGDGYGLQTGHEKRWKAVVMPQDDIRREVVELSKHCRKGVRHEWDAVL